ncbi:MAG TPA: glycosyltransferase [Solirubrobacterales bacterium]|nr:glycosyltransferase [Solirubrobacterales bacterium]
MAQLKFVPIPPHPLDRYRPLLGEERFERIERIAAEARRDFAGRAIWHVSSTARGGGVAEILHSLLPYVRGAGVDTRWVVLREAPEFFAITKRIHNHMHGDPGDGGELGEAERSIYELALAADAGGLGHLLQEGDVVYLHDPQTAGLVGAMKELGLSVIWRCHIGVDEPDELATGAREFLLPYVEGADAYVFSRREYVWEGLDTERVWLMPPAIDAFSPKNQELDAATVKAILAAIGLGPDGRRTAPSFVRGDGTPGRVERRAELLQEARVPAAARVVAQVSRWDRLKDPRGVLELFERFLDDPAIHLVLAAPAADAVADDPEGAVVYGDVAESWRRLPDGVRRRAHLVNLPMYDLDENGAMVNAIQRRADVLVQKSVAEGFGLTVAEGMWKGRPVVGSRVGGIQDQIVDGESGVLVDDPCDYEAFGREIRALLDDPARARAIGEAARRRIGERFLAVGRLAEYVELVASLVRIPA